MEFSAKNDIEAPIDYVFDQITDFPGFERSIMRRGGDVERVHGGDVTSVGTIWHVRFRLRGKDRKVRAELVEVDRPNGLSIAVTSPNADGRMIVELVALSRARTRMIVTAGGTAKSIAAKLFFQSLRLARNKTETRFKGTVEAFAKDVELRHKG